jgi:hypothetical protein
MKKVFAAALVAVLAVPALAQTTKNKPTPKPPEPGVSTTITTGGSGGPPPGSKPAEIQDVRIRPETSEDPYEFERLGYAAVQAKDLGRAREFFQKSWDLGPIPTAAYNLACLDAREGKRTRPSSSSKALGAGFDDEDTLTKDPDMAPLVSDPRFKQVLGGVRKNRSEGDAAVVKEDFPPSGKAAGGRPDPAARGPLGSLHDLEPVRDRGTARAFLVAARGPSRAGKRFAWGGPARTLAAVEATIAEARARAKNPSLPVFLVGVGSGGTQALIVAGRKAGVFAGVASLSGPFDPAGNEAAMVGLRGTRVFLGVAKDTQPNLVQAMRRTKDTLTRAGLSPALKEWVGTGKGLPNDVGAAVKDILDTFR